MSKYSKGARGEGAWVHTATAQNLHQSPWTNPKSGGERKKGVRDLGQSLPFEANRTSRLQQPSHLGLDAHSLSRLEGGGLLYQQKEEGDSMVLRGFNCRYPPSARGGQSDSHGELGLSGVHSAGREGLLQEPTARIRPHRSLFRNPRSDGILSDRYKHILSED